jgi:hypothetical protein
VDDASYLNDGYDSVRDIKSFFHASPHRFQAGDMLEPQPPSRRNFACSAGFVYLTDAPAPHYCIDVIAKEDGWLVYRVEPIGSVRPGLVDDLICERARVLESLGPASTFRGNSGVKMASSYYERRTEIMREPGLRRVKLAERALGAQIVFKQHGNQKQRRGRVVFADYDTLNLLIDTGEACQQLVSLKDCRVLALRDTPVPVLHGARLDVWQHGEGWHGGGIADPRVADAWLDRPVAVVA